MLYGGWSRGYRQGAANPGAYPDYQSYGPEVVDAFEIGAKTSFQSGDVSGQFNVAGFYNDLRNAQVQTSFLGATLTYTSLVNAGKARIYGLEADGSLRFGEHFRLNASGSYINSKVVKIDFPVPPVGYVNYPTTVQGDPLPFTPEWAGSVTGIVTLPVAKELGKVELSATYRYQAGHLVVASQFTNVRSTPISQVDLSLDVHDVGGQPVDLSFFASNLTNQFTVTSFYALQKLFGFDARNLGEPRMFGVRVKVRFGK
jgi:iron complex outermembrane receptor protein